MFYIQSIPVEKESGTESTRNQSRKLLLRCSLFPTDKGKSIFWMKNIFIITDVAAQP